MALSKYLVISVVILCLAGLTAGCGSDTAAPPRAPEAPLLPPLNLSAARSTDGDITLWWQPNPQSNLIGYNVYRAVSGSTNFTKLNPALVVSNSYTDQDASWNYRYDYRVTCVGANGAESDYASVTIYNGPGTKTGRDKGIE